MPVKSDSPARAAARARFAHFANEPDLNATVTAVSVDLDNPPMRDEDLARFRPADEVHPALVVAKSKGGRPRSETPKVAVSIRLDADLLEALRASGDGWQGRANAMLRNGLDLDAQSLTHKAP